MNNLVQLKKQNEQLRREVRMKREKTSKTFEELKRYMDEHRDEDYLVVGFGKKDPNPWKEKSSCELI